LKLLQLTAAILLSVTFAAYAQEAKPEGSMASNPVYQQNCAKCHGKSAQGRFMAGPSLVSGKATTMSVDDLRNIITNGKHHIPKIGEKLSATEIDSLVSQIKTKKQ
jgi:mono/diheme cytochrome c family protein